MKTLTLVRHAKSSWKDNSLSDHDRPLNKRGERDAPIMGKRLAAAGIRPSLIITSTANRAATTAKIIAEQLSYPQEFLQRDKALYLASVDDMLDVLVAQDNGFNNIMLVAHNPGMTHLVSSLSRQSVDMPTAAIAVFQLTITDWNQMRASDLFHLIHYMRPKAL